MTFWSSQTLEASADKLVESERVATADCNSFRLRVGEEIFVTPSIDEAFIATKRLLKLRESFLIPPQQFAVILTEESVNVPVDAMAFISMRATYKMQGLINVSGFHVDPGSQGPLLFAVFNAGPSPVHLTRGTELFLIWYANLDHSSEKHKASPGPNEIEPKRISHLTPAGDSLYALNKRLEMEAASREKANILLVDRVHDVEKAMTAIRVRSSVLLTIVVGVAAYLFRTELIEAAQAFKPLGV